MQGAHYFGLGTPRRFCLLSLRSARSFWLLHCWGHYPLCCGLWHLDSLWLLLCILILLIRVIRQEPFKCLVCQTLLHTRHTLVHGVEHVSSPPWVEVRLQTKSQTAHRQHTDSSAISTRCPCLACTLKHHRGGCRAYVPSRQHLTFLLPLPPPPPPRPLPRPAPKYSAAATRSPRASAQTPAMQPRHRRAKNWAAAC
jgi:hypothetical protein